MVWSSLIQGTICVSCIRAGNGYTSRLLSLVLKAMTTFLLKDWRREKGEGWASLDCVTTHWVEKMLGDGDCFYNICIYIYFLSTARSRLKIQTHLEENGRDSNESEDYLESNRKCILQKCSIIFNSNFTSKTSIPTKAEYAFDELRNDHELFLFLRIKNPCW